MNIRGLRNPFGAKERKEHMNISSKKESQVSKGEKQPIGVANETKIELEKKQSKPEKAAHLNRGNDLVGEI